MKKYYICFFILAALLIAAILTGSYFYVYRPQPEQPVPGGIIESETVFEDNMVINQRLVERRIAGPSDASSTAAAETEAKEELQYCLVAEDGFLLVFAKDRNTICLDTHMPLSEFPVQEQERLMDGIWFSTMIEIFNYLESFTS